MGKWCPDVTTGSHSEANETYRRPDITPSSERRNNYSGRLKKATESKTQGRDNTKSVEAFLKSTREFNAARITTPFSSAFWTLEKIKSRPRPLIGCCQFLR